MAPDTRRSFVFDIFIARSCRESGATLVSRNSADLTRRAKVFSFVARGRSSQCAGGKLGGGAPPGKNQPGGGDAELTPQA